MEYNLRVHDATYRIEAEPSDKTGRAAVAVDGETKQMVWTAFSEHDLSIDIDGQRMNASFARTGQGVWVWLEGRARFVQDASQQRRRKRADEVIPSEVTPPTPAVVVRVLVNKRRCSRQRTRAGGSIRHENGNHALCTLRRYCGLGQYLPGQPGETGRYSGGNRPSD